MDIYYYTYSIMSIRILVLFATFSYIIIGVDLLIEPFIVGGSLAKIDDFPHSAFLSIITNNDIWICGSSIINQNILMTAAHCLEDCSKSSKMNVVVGSERRDKGFRTTVSRFIVHQKYDRETLTNDIALIKVKTPLPLGPKVKRIVLQISRPLNEVATVAGWGVIDEASGTRSLWLKYGRQKLWSHKSCKQILKSIPKGVICGGEPNADSDFAAPGDSGSALIIRGYIQIGIVSNKFEKISRSLVVYTDVKYFYNWILKSVRKLSC